MHTVRLYLPDWLVSLGSCTIWPLAVWTYIATTQVLHGIIDHIIFYLVVIWFVNFYINYVSSGGWMPSLVYSHAKGEYETLAKLYTTYGLL